MKTTLKSIIISLFMLPMVVAQGATQDQTFVVRNNDTIVASISKREITRIVFESDISFISSITGELEYTTKDQDLYLRPNVEKPINFFVKTADEQTYKFLVDANNVPATQIFIKNNQRNSDGKLVLYKKHNIAATLQKHISKLVNIALNPQKHPDFKFKKSNKHLGTIDGLSLQKIAEIEDSLLNAEIVVVTNKSKAAKTLNTLEFLDEQTMAIYIENPVLKVGEKTKLVKIKGSDEANN